MSSSGPLCELPPREVLGTRVVQGAHAALAAMAGSDHELPPIEGHAIADARPQAPSPCDTRATAATRGSCTEQREADVEPAREVVRATRAGGVDVEVRQPAVLARVPHRAAQRPGED